jgi:hypothetical protein
MRHPTEFAVYKPLRHLHTRCTKRGLRARHGLPRFGQERVGHVSAGIRIHRDLDKNEKSKFGRSHPTVATRLDASRGMGGNQRSLQGGAHGAAVTPVCKPDLGLYGIRSTSIPIGAEPNEGTRCILHQS